MSGEGLSVGCVCAGVRGGPGPQKQPNGDSCLNAGAEQQLPFPPRWAWHWARGEPRTSRSGLPCSRSAPRAAPPVLAPPSLGLGRSPKGVPCAWPAPTMEQSDPSPVVLDVGGLVTCFDPRTQHSKTEPAPGPAGQHPASTAGGSAATKLRGSPSQAPRPPPGGAVTPGDRWGPPTRPRRGRTPPRTQLQLTLR